ncbi:ATP-binding protein [Jiulongibacter sediminis]|uniref:histidine kinase n=1 Tax=Jiulongibacter sediminis TaxID=1605367 RepID=A0A0P7BK67_9BACT|nr:tetratricopeptide repeat-containing sensor histidine kinase [Jiulongibacter sediminis]KPM47648.1 hypothetical protein AFM12_14300 [Jiulongibacter sediminis]TBX23440.1 hypothetical protein TK44_14310 [Jiulongibacter sediminis]
MTKNLLFLLFLPGLLTAQLTPLEKMDSLYNIAQLYDDAKIDSLRIMGKQLRTLTKESGVPQGELYALRFEGWADEYEGNYGLALPKYLEMLEKARKANDKFSINAAFNDMGAVYLHTNQYERAKSIYQEAISNPELQQDNPKRLSVFYNNLGIAYRRLDLLDSALYSYGESLKIKEELGDERGMADLRINMASLMVKLERYDEAEKYTLQNLDYLKGKDLKADVWANTNNLASVKFGQDKYQEALRLFEKSLGLAEELNSKERIMETQEHLATVHENIGNYRQALSYYRQAESTRQEIINVETNERISELQEQYNARERETENELLNTQLTSQRQQRTLLIGGLLLALAAVAGIAFALQKNRRKNAQLARQNRLIEKQRDKLTELNSEKNNLISIVSHDLRSPFNSILLWNRTLRENLASSPLKVAESSEMIEKMAGYGQEMIDNILDIERMEINSHTIDVQPLPLAEFISELIADFAPAAKGKDITIVNDFNLSEDFIFQTDGKLLRRALENLISNALKFSNRHAKVWLKVYKDGKKLHFQVKDLGVGISKEDQSLLFKKYGKTASTPTDGEQSTGLGLSIVKRIADELGAKVTVKSEPGKGSVFGLVFRL